MLNRVGADKQKSTEADDQLYVKKDGGWWIPCPKMTGPGEKLKGHEFNIAWFIMWSLMYASGSLHRFFLCIMETWMRRTSNTCRQLKLEFVFDNFHVSSSKWRMAKVSTCSSKHIHLKHVLQKALFLFNMKLIFLYSEHYFRKKSFGINNGRTVFLQQEE